MGCFENRDRRAGLQSNLGHFTHQRLEVGVLRDKVGFRVDLNRDTAAVVDGHANQAFRGHTVCLFGSLGQAFGAQPVDGGFHVAIGFDKRLFGVHHPCAG